MSYNQRDTTRWTARVGSWLKGAIFFIAEVLESFLNFKDDDALRIKGFKTADFVLRRGVYLGLDYGLAALHLSLGVTMKALGFSLTTIFIVLWMFDFLAAGFFIVIYEVTGKDLSLGEDFRRAVDTVNGKSRLAGLLAVAGVVFLAVVWTGPEKVVTFFRKEIGTIRRVMVVLTTLTAIQAFIWACVYVFGYTLATKLL